MTSFVPHLHLFAETLLLNGEDPESQRRRRSLAFVRLDFDYDGTCVRCQDQRQAFFRASANGLVSVPRDLEGERQACMDLERLGVCDIEGLLELGVCPSRPADYVIDPSGDEDALASFCAGGVSQLEQAGFRVTRDDSNPLGITTGRVRWVSTAQPGNKPGWFDLALGVEIDGERHDILPALMHLLKERQAEMSLEALERSGRPFIAVPLGRGRILPVARERLVTILSVLIELYDGPRLSASALALPECRLPSLAALSGVGWVPPKGVEQRPALLDAPPGLQATLRPYQRDGVAWMQGLAASGCGGILADDMGLGKTLQTIAHLLALRLSGRLDAPALIIVPTSLLGNWQRELARFAPSLSVFLQRGPHRHHDWSKLSGHHIVLTTYGLLLRDVDRWRRIPLSALVLDEAHAIKSTASQLHRAARRLQAKQRICLTGTPLENNLGELWALLDFCCPSVLGSRERFERLYRRPIEQEGSQARLRSLRDRIAPYVLRRVKRLVAPELPAKTEIVQSVELTQEQRDLYESIRLAVHDRVRRVVQERGLARSRIDVLDALLKLRQVCCDPRLVRVEAARKAERSAKLEVLLAMLRELVDEGRRVLVFSQFARMLGLIAEELSGQGLTHCCITGQTQARDAEVNRFQQGEAPIFLLSLKAAGTGLNLTAADTVIHYDPWWNPAAQDQATGRAHRIGQNNPVFAYSLIVAGSVEERMLSLQSAKRRLAREVLRTSSGPTLNETELDVLLAPLDGAHAMAGPVEGATGIISALPESAPRRPPVRPAPATCHLPPATCHLPPAGVA